MCGTCSGATHRGRRTWTASSVVVLALVATLVALSAFGLVLRERERGIAGSCVDVTRETEAYETLFTRHLDDGPGVLIGDTKHFVGRVTAQDGAACAGLKAFVREVEPMVRAVCAPCAATMRRTLTRPS